MDPYFTRKEYLLPTFKIIYQNLVLGSVDDGDPVGERKGIIPGFGCTGGLCIEKSRHCTDSAHQVDLRRCHLHAVTALAVNMLPGTTCELLIFG